MSPPAGTPPGHAEDQGFAWHLGRLASWEGPSPKAAPSPQGPEAPRRPSQLPGPGSAPQTQAPFLPAAGVWRVAGQGLLEYGLMLGSSWTIVKVALAWQAPVTAA